MQEAAPAPTSQQENAQAAAASVDVVPPAVEEVASPTRARQDAFVEIVHSEGMVRSMSTEHRVDLRRHRETNCATCSIGRADPDRSASGPLP